MVIPPIIPRRHVFNGKIFNPSFLLFSHIYEDISLLCHSLSFQFLESFYCEGHISVACWKKNFLQISKASLRIRASKNPFLCLLSLPLNISIFQGTPIKLVKIHDVICNFVSKTNGFGRLIDVNSTWTIHNCWNIAERMKWPNFKHYKLAQWLIVCIKWLYFKESLATNCLSEVSYRKSRPMLQ